MIENIGIRSLSDSQLHMTLRDYFAAKAMEASLLSLKGFDHFEEAVKVSAKAAYFIADAMLAERDK